MLQSIHMCTPLYHDHILYSGLRRLISMHVRTYTLNEVKVNIAAYRLAN